MYDYSNRSVDEALCKVISDRQAQLIEKIGAKTVTNRIIALINNYGLTVKDCPYEILLAAALFIGADVKTCVDEETK